MSKESRILKFFPYFFCNMLREITVGYIGHRTLELELEAVVL
jgi:hypothetical protein